MTSPYIQDTFEPYYAGRKSPIPTATASKEREAERREAAQQLAERAKRARTPPLADVEGKKVDPSP